MFRKTTALFLTAFLIILSVSAATAAGTGLFGELSGGEGADERLALLDGIAEEISVSLEGDPACMVSQAYCEGNRIFISYRAGGNHVVIQDGLDLGEDSYADIIAGDETEQEDGTVIGWKECIIPEDEDGDVLTFGLVFGESYESDGRNSISFTVKRNGYDRYLRGVSPANAYRAEAELALGKLDLKGTVRVFSPEQTAGWLAMYEEEKDTGVDVILCWNLYRNGEPVSIDLYGASGVNGTDELVFELMFPFMDDLSGLTLVPEYVEGGEKQDEAIPLEPVIPE